MNFAQHGLITTRHTKPVPVLCTQLSPRCSTSVRMKERSGAALEAFLDPLPSPRRRRARTTPGRTPGSPFLLHPTRTRTRQPPSLAASARHCATAARMPRSPPELWTRSNPAAVTSMRAARDASPPTRRPKAKQPAPRRLTAARAGPTSGCGRARGPGRRTTRLIRSGPGGDGTAVGPGRGGGPTPYTFQARWAGKQGQAGGRVREAIVLACACARGGWQGALGAWGAKKRRARLGRGALQISGALNFQKLF